VLKAALAGALLTLPFAPSAAARAAEEPCTLGCLYAAGRRQDADLAACAKKQRQCLMGLYSRLYRLPILQGEALNLADSACLKLYGAETAACYERAITEKKARYWDCISGDGCGGFDPQGPFGPCEEWAKQGFLCCPDPKSPVGYCPAGTSAAGTGSCCDPAGNGCLSGVTNCGGGKP
jgi:hypothetical protein